VRLVLGPDDYHDDVDDDDDDVMTAVAWFIMMMFYARIYRTASRASAAVRRGFISTGDVHASSSSSSRLFGHSQSLTPSRSESCIALRVHLGGLRAAFRVHRGGLRAASLSGFTEVV